MKFHGFVEGNDISAGAVDVVVTDGFTGNVALKTAEGMAKMISSLLKTSLTSSLLSKLGAAIAMPALKKFQSRLDPRSSNGAVFLGLNGLVVKSHGGTDGYGFEKAITVAADMGSSRFKAELTEQLAKLMAAVQATPASTEQAGAGASEETAK